MRLGGASVNIADSASRLIGNPSVFDQSLYPRTVGDVAGHQYVKAALLYSRRAPRRILLYDDFEGATLKWNQVSGTVTRDTTAAGVFAPTAAMKMVTGIVAGNSAQAQQVRGYQTLQKYVMEVWWAMSAAAATTPRRFVARVVVIDGTNQHYLEVAYLKNLTTPQNKWQFSADGTAYTDVAGGAETLDVDAAVPFIWHYLRAHFNMSLATPNLDELHTDTLDLTGLTAAGGTAALGTRKTLVDVFGTTDAAAAATFLVGYVLLSQNEA